MSYLPAQTTNSFIHAEMESESEGRGTHSSAWNTIQKKLIFIVRHYKISGSNKKIQNFVNLESKEKTFYIGQLNLFLV